MLIVALGATTGCAGSGSPSASIDPRADRALRAMCATVGGAQAMHFRVDAQVDEASGAGKRIQVSRRTDVLMRRPDSLVVQMQSGEGQWSLHFKAGKLAIWKGAAGQYAALETPPTTEKMLDYLFEEHGLSVPLADLLFSDPYQALTEDVQAGTYLGLHSVGERLCHHLLFTQAKVDWQVWIDSGPAPLPRKVVITHKNQPGQPQYSAELSDWNLAPTIAETSFDFKAPPGAKAVSIADLRGEKGK